MAGTVSPRVARVSSQPSIQPVGDHVLAVLPDASQLVFGLNWHPIIGSRIDALARKKAHAERATHYVYGGAGAAAVGCGRLRKGARPCYAAAQVFAALYPQGIAVGIMSIDPTRVWVVATHDGAVMARTDRIYPGMDQAQAALGEIRSVHPGAMQNLRRLEMAELTAALDPAAALWRVGLPLPRLPLPVQGTVLLLVLALLLPPAWRAWRRPAVGPAPTQAEAAAAWHKALARAAASKTIHDALQLGRVFAALKALPLSLHGWALASAHCHPAASDWACSARYARRSPIATNRSLAAAAPSGARTVFEALDEARIDWSVPDRRRTLAPALLPSATDTDLVLGSTLQAIRPAFADVALGAPAPLVIEAPRAADGSALDPPADLPRMRQRSILMSGPLRSFALLAEPPATIGWSEVALAMQSERDPAIGSSALMAQLQGVIYERE